MNGIGYLKEFKSFASQNNMHIDFRSDVHILNNIGAYPIIPYERGHEIIFFCFEFINKELEKRDIKAISYNVANTLEQARTFTFKSIVATMIHEHLEN